MRDALPRHDTHRVFHEHAMELLESACRSAGSFRKGEKTCMEAELRKVGPLAGDFSRWGSVMVIVSSRGFGGCYQQVSAI